MAALALGVGTQLVSALPSGSITIGNLTFSDFFVTGVDPNSVNVTAAPTVPDGEYAGIAISGPFVAIGTPTDFGFGYTVTATDPNGNPIPLIHDIGQGYTITGPIGSGQVFITETAFDQGFNAGNQLAQSTLTFFDRSDPDPEAIQGDHLIMDSPHSKVYITKDILLLPGGDVIDPNTGADLGPSVIGATTLVQYISEVPVPDGGSTLILLGLAFSGMGIAVRFKNKFVRNS